ncbi:MAG: PQQ-binding-like beta-propeller repeat protein [Acidobacteriota bacterium]
MILAWAALAAFAFAQPPGVVEAGRKQFQARCAGCHGADGMGGERAPAISNTSRAEYDSDKKIRELIRRGIPDAGMPPFQVPEPQFTQLVAFVRSRIGPASESAVAGDAAAGAAFFFGKGRCASCHMVRGRGGIDGPDLTNAGRELTLAEIEQTLRDPNARRRRGYRVAAVKLKSGAELRGFIRNESDFDLQLQGFDHKLHLLRAGEIASVERDPNSYMPALDASDQERQDVIAFLVAGKPAPGGVEAAAEALEAKPGDWPTYNGSPSGNRYSGLDGITPANVAGLAPRWMFSLPGAQRLEVTPVVVDGVMYVTNVNEAYALDARSGRAIWHYSRPRTPGVIGDAAGGINRGVAVAGGRVFLVTDNAHLLALDRITGGLVWDVEMADYREHYGATSAPLVVGDLVISGTSGGDEGIRGFVGAYKASTGERVWRFSTVLDKTWAGRALEHPCVAAWLTGSYDPDTGLLFWPTGNPCPDFNGDERKGDNLYGNSVVALDPATGALKWHYQFTPHDLHDWDSTETVMVVNTAYQGRERKLLLHADRNGFFYVLDRTTGEFLGASPFVKKLTWASGVGKDGRPVLLPGAEPTVEGSRACPSMDGATNWMSAAFHPRTRLFYVMALEKCSIYMKSSAWWQPGESFYGGAAREVPGERPEKYLRAIELDTGRIAWERRQTGPANTWGGVLATASGLVFFGEDSGAFAAVDAASGEMLWHFQLSAHWKASPMTYMVDGKQYVAVAAGGNIVAFGLP